MHIWIDLVNWIFYEKYRTKWRHPHQIYNNVIFKNYPSKKNVNCPPHYGDQKFNRVWCRKGCQSQGWFLIDNSFTWTIFVVVAAHPRNRQCCDTLEFRSAKKQVNNSDFIIPKIVVLKMLFLLHIVWSEWSLVALIV